MQTTLDAPISFRGETYTNNRRNREFIRLWGRFFARNSQVAVYDCYMIFSHHRDAGAKERKAARDALRALRAWYVVARMEAASV